MDRPHQKPSTKSARCGDLRKQHALKPVDEHSAARPSIVWRLKAAGTVADGKPSSWASA